MECPDVDCHDKVIKNNTILKVGGSIISILIFLLIAWNGNRLLAESKQNDKIAACKEKLPAIEKSVEHMATDMSDIKVELKDMRHNQRHDSEVLHKRITESEAKILEAIEKMR